MVSKELPFIIHNRVHPWILVEQVPTNFYKLDGYEGDRQPNSIYSIYSVGWFKIGSSMKIKDHRVNYTTGRNLCNGRNLVELVAVKCTTPVMEYDV